MASSICQTNAMGARCATGYVCNAAPESGPIVTGTCEPCGATGQSCCTDRFDPMTRGQGSCGGPLCTDGSTCNHGPLSCQ